MDEKQVLAPQRSPAVTEQTLTDEGCRHSPLSIYRVVQNKASPRIFLHLR